MVVSLLIVQIIGSITISAQSIEADSDLSQEIGLDDDELISSEALPLLEETETTTSSVEEDELELTELEMEDVATETEPAGEATLESTEVSPRRVIDSQSYTEVGTLLALEAAIKNKENVILTDNIVINKRIDLFDGFHLIGRNPWTQQQHTLTIKNYGYHDHFNMAISNSQFRIEDVSIMNENYYGIVHVGAAYTNVKQYYHNVTYYSENAQAFWGPNSDVYLSGTSHFTQVNGGGRAQEFGELNRLHISGTARISHDSTSLDPNLHVFMYLVGSGEAGIYIDDEADVEIETKKTLFYNSSQVSSMLHVGKNARLKLSIGGNYLNVIPDKNNSFQFDEGSNVEILDTSKTSGKSAIDRTRFLPVTRRGMLTASAHSQVKIVTDNRTNLIQLNTAEGYVGFGQVASAVLENTYNNRLFNFYSNGSQLFLVQQAVETYEQIGGGLSHSWPNVTATVLYKLAQPSVTESNSQRFAREFPATANLAKLVLKPAASLELSHEPITDQSLQLVGETSSGGIVVIEGFYHDGTPFVSPEIKPDSTGSFTWSLPQALKANSNLTFVVQEEDLVELRVTAKVMDTIGPTATPLLQLVNVADIANPAFDQLVKELVDNGGEATIEMLEADLTAVPGRQQVIARGTDSSGNYTDFVIPVFVYDDQSVVGRTSDTTGIMLRTTPIEAYPEEVTGELETFINGRLNRQIWNEQGSLDSSLVELVDTDLEELPLPGEYQVSHRYLTHEITTAITILNRGKDIDLMIPKDVLFGSLSSQLGAITSPNYEIQNWGMTTVSLSVSSLNKTSLDNFELVDIPDLRSTNQAQLYLNAAEQRVLLEENMSADFLGNVRPNQTLKFNLSGQYYGNYLETLRPSYRLNLVFTSNEE